MSVAPRVSIITGAYNQARYLTRTVESVFTQTFTDYEHIVVDDGSLDDTGSVLAPYLSRIQYIRQENQGNVASRNRAMQSARGELIAILDGDDWWAPTKLAQQIALLDACPEVGLVYTGMYEIDEHDTVISKMRVEDISDDPLRHQLLGNATPFSSLLVRRSVLNDDKLVDPRFNLVGDRFLTLQVALQGYKFACIPEGLLYMRTHGASMRYSASFRTDYLRQMLEAIYEIQRDTRLPRGYAGVLKQAYARAYYTSAWLIIDRGDVADRKVARALLLKSLAHDWRMAFAVIKQLVKSHTRLGRSAWR